VTVEDAYDRFLAAATDHGSIVKEARPGVALAQCLAHDDRVPSLTVTRIEGQVLVHCHAECPIEDVVGAVGLQMRDLYDSREGADYRYPDGRVVYRMPNKTFRQSGNTKGCTLFHVEKIGDATTINVVEGEKDVLAIEAAGGTAVCSAQGAGKSHRANWMPLDGRDVVIWADRDDVGRRHATQVAEQLADIAASVRIVEAAVGKDAADHIAAGMGLDALLDAKWWSPTRKSKRQAKITWADTITPEPVTWAWEGDLEDSDEDSQPQNLGTLESWRSTSGRIAAGTLAVAAGPEGVGKSCFGIILSARVSNATLPGAWYGTPRRVLYAAVEDSWKHTIVPRLIAAGADRSSIGRIEVIFDSDDAVTMSLPVDNALLEQQIVEHNVALVVLDPMLSLISENIDSHRERDVRRALDPLAALAERTGAVILGIAHFNKGSGSDVSARITGSGAFKNVPRAVFGFARDPETGDCVLTQSKNSLGRYDLPSLRYRIESVTVPTPTGAADTGRFIPLGESEKSVGDILAASGRSSDDQGDDGLTPAQRFIIGYIEDHGDENGEVPSREVITAGVPAGYTDVDLVKARNKAKTKILTRKAKGARDDGWLWSLAPDVQGSGAQRADSEDSEDSKIPSLEEREESVGITAPSRPGVGGLYGDLCACGKFAARYDSGLCEWCTAKARKS
jgi:5S rRNA maturation endonuclease (ribonuclease M5)